MPSLMRGALFVLALGVFPAGAEDGPRLLRGPYLQRASSDSVVIVWRTTGRIDPVVKYGKARSSLDRTVPAAAIGVNDRLQKGIGGFAADDVLEEGTCQYEARIEGLEPLTSYAYAVYDGARMLAGGDETFSFKTYPVFGRAAPVRFAAFGDSHGEPWNKSGIEAALKELCAREKHPADFALHLGDMTIKGQNKEYQYIFDPPFMARRRDIVLWPTPGNHDLVSASPDAGIAGPYADAFVLPTRGEAGGAGSGTEAFYSFDYGRAHFVSLSSFHVSREPDGPMVKWLQADLAKAKADGKTDWLIAFFHSPTFGGEGPANKSERQTDVVEARAFIMPVLEAGGVDLTLSGHMHVYERTLLMDGLYARPITGKDKVLDAGDGPYRKSAGLNPHQGEVAVMVGAGNGSGEEGEHPVSRRLLIEGGMLVVDIDGDTLNARMLRNDGAIRDTFGIVKRGKVTPRRVAAPKAEIARYCRCKLPGTRVALVPFVGERVALDGKLDEEAWKKAFQAGLRGDDGLNARLLAAPDALYAGVDFVAGGASRETRRDGGLIALDPTVELYIDVAHDGKETYEFTCNPAGVKRDAKDGDPGYDPEWEVKTGNAGRGVAEMRIPWPAMGMKGPPGGDAVLGMNIVTNRGGAGGELFPGRGDARFIGLQRPAQFGWVRFGPGRVESLAAPQDDRWKYLAGKDPSEGWTRTEFDDASWAAGAPGFGYGDIENSTRLPGMKGKYSRVYARRTFEVKDAAALSDLALVITYDDAFIAYLNGREVLRVGVAEGSGARAKGVAVHEGSGPEYPADQRIDCFAALEGVPLSPEYFSLAKHLGLLRAGANVLAVEGHNAGVSSKTFTLDPQLAATQGR